MKVLGIVAEYNPFHNGHKYHLENCRSISGADCIVAVMSGNFTQRGEPAVVDKWARCEMALMNGIDLVIELPCVYAMSSAEYFAYGAVKLLDSMGQIDMICFGSECGSIGQLDIIANILCDEPDEYRALLKKELSEGKSFPSARHNALKSYLKTIGHDDLSDILKSPNNILGIEYLKALKKLKSSIKPLTIRRVGNDYNSTEMTGDISSATAIRKLVESAGPYAAADRLRHSLPEESLRILMREFELGRGPVFPSDFSMLLLSMLRKMPADEIAKLPYMENGLENRIKLAAETSGSYEELLENICTRRYAATRIQRCLFSLLTGLTGNIFKQFNDCRGPSYIRILGFNSTGRQLLSLVKKSASLPIITKTADFKNSDIPAVASMLGIEASAADQYVLAFKNPALRRSGTEFTHGIVQI